MLFFLTGDIQIGKTRWLTDRIDELCEFGVECCGVIAPGTWIHHADGFEKTGIDNLLLPDRRLIPFARRRDLACAEGSFDARSQAARAQLGWAIDDAAVDQVNGHFRHLASVQQPGARLLVVDEFGRLELERGEGLTETVGLIERGASAAFPHALVIVRAQLLPLAQTRFSAAPWNGMRVISPDEDGRRALMEAAGRMQNG